MAIFRIWVTCMNFAVCGHFGDNINILLDGLNSQEADVFEKRPNIYHSMFKNYVTLFEDLEKCHACEVLREIVDRAKDPELELVFRVHFRELRGIQV